MIIFVSLRPNANYPNNNFNDYRNEAKRKEICISRLCTRMCNQRKSNQ